MAPARNNFFTMLIASWWFSNCFFLLHLLIGIFFFIRKGFPFSLIYLFMSEWVYGFLFYSTACNPLLLLFFLMFSLSQIGSVGAPSDWRLSLYDKFPSFWAFPYPLAQKGIPDSSCIFSTQSLKPAISILSKVWFYRAVDVLVVAGVWLLLGPDSGRARTYVYLLLSV